MNIAQFQVFAALLHTGSGLVIGPEKQYLLESRLGPVLERNRLPSLAALADRLRGMPISGTLAKEVIEAMTTNESLFFRDDRPFVHFRTHALPGLIAARPPGARLRIWSAAASTGQEAYSLAMLLADNRAMLADRTVEIIGTDIAQGPLDRAREGLYSQFEVQRGLPMQSLVRHFRKEGANWRIAQPIRDMVRFQVWNLLSDLSPLGLFDIVFCRNVLIYFDQATKSRVLEAISRRLPPDGLLYLGGAETVLGLSDAFTPVPNDRGVYAKRASRPSGTSQKEMATLAQR